MKRLVVVCEDEGHVRVTTTIADKALSEVEGWVADSLEHLRRWQGLTEEARWYKYDPEDAEKLMPVVVDGVRITGAGHIGGEPLKPEASMWRKALMLCADMSPRPDVVLLVRDLDGYPARRDGMTQVVDGIRWPFKVVMATPEPEIEAWWVSGFHPEDAMEEERLRTLTEDLSFNPTTASHRLTSHPNDAPTDAKRVLAALTVGDEPRRDGCLADHGRLLARGAHNGCAAFLDGVYGVVVPTVAGGPPRSPP